jgi:ABC-type Co2+ transport system permease subunit
MAHIHLPDGVFSLQWVIVWWALALIVLAVALLVFRLDSRSRLEKEWMGSRRFERPTFAV